MDGWRSLCGQLQLVFYQVTRHCCSLMLFARVGKNAEYGSFVDAPLYDKVGQKPFHLFLLVFLPLHTGKRLTWLSGTKLLAVMQLRQLSMEMV
jgi:hypothetical protein